MTVAVAPVEQELNAIMASLYHEPLQFVEVAYPWGRTGTPLAQHDGPDVWQRDFLTRLGDHVKARAFNGTDPVQPIRMGVSSGHGIGKSVEVAWVTNWIMSTRPRAKGTITANTFTQLRDKTWASIQHWTSLCLTGHWFIINADRMYHAAQKESWFCAPQSCKEQNSEAFAGQHALDSTSFYIFDEASAVPDSIFEVAEGGLTDGEPMIFLFGNPTRSTGAFYRACFGSMRHRWDTRAIDSRTCKFTNKAQIAEWVTDYGEDSDFVRVRVRGLPPSASDLQFIDQDRVWQAQTRTAVTVLEDEPLIAGVDVSDGGAAWNVVRFRRGADARTLPPIRVPGQATRGDRSAFLARLAEVLRDDDPRRRVTMMFVDSAFGAPYVERLHAMGFQNVREVRFGATALDTHQANMRAFMWNRMKEWLPTGMIPADDTRLEVDLTAPGYHLNQQDKLVIESKETLQKRGISSPDDGDALALTFAAPVAPRQPVQPPPYKPTGIWS